MIVTTFKWLLRKSRISQTTLQQQIHSFLVYCNNYTLYLVVTPKSSSRKGFSGLTRVEYHFAMRFCSDSGIFNLVLNPSVLFDFTISFGRLFQFEITSGKNELDSWVVEMVLDLTSYCSSWERRSLVIFSVAYWFRSRWSSPWTIL